MRTQITIDEPLVLEGAPVEVAIAGKVESAVVNAPPAYIHGKGWEYSVRFTDGSGWMTVTEKTMRIKKPDHG